MLLVLADNLLKNNTFMSTYCKNYIAFSTFFVLFFKYNYGQSAVPVFTSVPHTHRRGMYIIFIQLLCKALSKSFNIYVILLCFE